MTGPIEDRPRRGRLSLLAIFCACFIIGATVTSIVSSVQRADDLAADRERDRQRSCETREAIVEAFGFYTDALIGASASREDELPPEEQARRTEQIDAFRAAVAEHLSPIRCPQPIKETPP